MAAEEVEGGQVAAEEVQGGQEGQAAAVGKRDKSKKKRRRKKREEGVDKLKKKRRVKEQGEEKAANVGKQREDAEFTNALGAMLNQEARAEQVCGTSLCNEYAGFLKAPLCLTADLIALRIPPGLGLWSKGGVD